MRISGGTTVSVKSALLGSSSAVPVTTATGGGVSRPRVGRCTPLYFSARTVPAPTRTTSASSRSRWNTFLSAAFTALIADQLTTQ